MNCATARELLSAYVDAELPHAQATELAVHLTGCGSCAAETEAMLTTVRTLRSGLSGYEAPDVLRARVRGAIREPEGASPPAPVRMARGDRRVSWRALAAGVLIAAASSAVTLVAARGSIGSARAESGTLEEQLLASHIRSLMPSHLTDVASNDQHNVKPWFNGRLDYSPVVPRLDSLGFPLLGGRLDYVGGRPVAVVVYGRRQHVVNVFSWPSDSAGDVAMAAAPPSHGYNVLRWRRGGVEYWAVSDLNATELRELARLVR